MKTRRFYDNRTGTTWHLSPDGQIADRDGNGPGEDDARIRASFARRERSRGQQRARDAELRGLGLVKVRGSAGGTFWE